MQRVCVGQAFLLLATLLTAWQPAAADEPRAPKKIVLIAGTKSHGPGEHEYEKGVRLLEQCLNTSPDMLGLKTEVCLDGWPQDEKVFDDAATVLLFSDGSDRQEQAHPLLREQRLQTMQKLMDRGVGFVAIHYTLFVPAKKGGSQFLDWAGGYFDYENGKDARGWFSRIKNCTAKVTPASPQHPVCRGVSPFELKEEFYYNMRLRPDDKQVTPILSAAIPDEPAQVVAWAVERKDGGRGFGYTGGHYHANWQEENVRRMVLNALVWTAKGEVPAGGVRSRLPEEPAAKPLVEGKFGNALNARQRHAEAKPHNVYQKPPLTVECWAKLDGAAGFNLLVANNLKESASHWEIYTVAGSGTFSAFLPGRKPDVIDSGSKIVDGRWHYLAMVYEAERVRLFVDAKLVKDTAISGGGGAAGNGSLWFGAYPPQSLGCDGLVDEVRISNVVRAIDGVPDKPPAADDNTIGLWRFDKLDAEAVADESKLHNPAVIRSAKTLPAAPVGPSSRTELDYQPADARLKVVLLDRSPSESYVAVKADTEGRLFVTGREGLFVFEPDAKGGYGPRQELYRFPPDSWVAGIEVRGDDLYVLTGSALYLFPGGRIKRTGLSPRRLVWGVPLDLHVSCHSLAWGPEGDLYVNHGDPLLNYGDFSRPDHWGHWTVYTQPEGTKVPYTGAGCVFRVHPDGSGFQVVAEGFRGCFGMTFDKHWNLFTNDNDHESIPDRYTPARLMHVTPYADFAWPGGWVAAKNPDRADLLETMLEAPGRGVPVGLAYYDEPYFPSEYRHNLLQDRWDRLTILRHPLEQRGASFTTRELPFLTGRERARPIGVAVGRDGRVFATISYMAGNEASPHYVSDLIMVTRADDTPEHPFEPYDVTKAAPAKLWTELSSPFRERRVAAHTEILRRGGTPLTEATHKLARLKVDDPAMDHLPWLAGASGSAEAAKLLIAAAGHPRREVRLQVVRVLAEFAELHAPRSLFETALTDCDPEVQRAALTAYFKREGDLPLPAVVKLAGSRDTYLRQTAARLLARRASLADFDRLTHSEEAPVRMAAVLAAGMRLTTPPLDQPPPTAVRLTFPADNAFFKGKIPFADAEVDLRTLGRVGSYTTAEYWKAIEPSKEQRDLFDLLLGRLDDPADSVRLQAAYYLGLLRDPRSEPAITRVVRTVEENRLAGATLRDVTKAWVLGPFDDDKKGFNQAHPPEQGAVDLSAEYPSPMTSENRAWQEKWTREGVFDLPTLSPPLRRSSCYAFFRLQSPTRQPLLLLAGPFEGIKVWHNGRLIVENVGNNAAMERLLLDVQPGSNDLLVRIGCSNGPPALRLQYRARGEVSATLPEKLGFATLAQRLHEATASGKAETIAPEFLTVDWQREVREGDREQGRKLFGTLGCVKCHAVTADQKGGGAPSLTEAGKRFTVPYLVESILLPSKQVADAFRATTLTTRGGLVFTGLVVNETADELELLLPDANHKTMRKSDIEERNLNAQSPMPGGIVKTPRELRDLLAYLLSDNPLPP